MAAVKRVTAKAKLEALQKENDELKTTVKQLKSVNSQQLARLVDQTLLQARMDELKKRVSEKGDE